MINYPGIIKDSAALRFSVLKTIQHLQRRVARLIG